ncbi:hypothetical protein DUNSADRAFT_1626 [Dunaliella salina]|uniref:Uncharacterized protein n=1 Tax=Dunaliella salina TaxID=3046 RepID=A0ABQ7GWV4_DUNSA|nr:hypothetical protein DUNSADRAFT_1626 [Dunaliella salina]|eukprot:KAF5839081.1 hypothetical protein DUNSADRAFT_1626 [Dunaliella salina]
MLTASHHLSSLCSTQQRINTHALAPLNASPLQHQQPKCRALSIQAGKPFLATNSPIRKRFTPAAAPEGKPDTPQEKPVKYNTEFGYSRKDVTLICAGLIALGYALYYGLQAAGMDAGMAGNWVQLAIFVGICIGWVSTYLFRVATKQMTYVKQLEDYEEAVMRKRVEEMTEDELNELISQSSQAKGSKQ